MPIEVYIYREQDCQAISLEEYQKRRVMRRRRVAKRLYKKCPLFAVQEMQAEFPGYTYEMLIADLTRKTRKSRSKRKVKSPLKRQGRYPLYLKAMTNYHLTKDENYLAEAQRWRDRLYLNFRVEARLNGEVRVFEYPSTMSLDIIRRLGAIKFSSWEEMEQKKAQVLKWAHLH